MLQIGDALSLTVSIGGPATRGVRFARKLPLFSGFARVHAVRIWYCAGEAARIVPAIMMRWSETETASVRSSNGWTFLRAQDGVSGSVACCDAPPGLHLPVSSLAADNARHSFWFRRKKISPASSGGFPSADHRRTADAKGNTAAAIATLLRMPSRGWISGNNRTLHDLRIHIELTFRDLPLLVRSSRKATAEVARLQCVVPLASGRSRPRHGLYPAGQAVEMVDEVGDAPSMAVPEKPSAKSAGRTWRLCGRRRSSCWVINNNRRLDVSRAGSHRAARRGRLKEPASTSSMIPLRDHAGSFGVRAALTDIRSNGGRGTSRDAVVACRASSGRRSVPCRPA